MATTEEELTRVSQELAELREEYHDIVYAMSHDLNAPFRSIQGFSELIYETNINQLDAKSKKYFEFVNKGVDQGKGILDALLALSRLETNAKPFGLVDCNNVMTEVQASLHDEIKSSNAKISCAGMPTVMGDKSQLLRLFSELLNNALLYQRANSQPKVEVTVLEKEHVWQFSFKDNGTGVPDNIANEIFKPLKRGVSDELPGAGVGLTLARKIVKRHRGDIELESSTQQGSIFNFTIAKEHDE